MERAIKELPERDFFDRVSEGIDHVVEVAGRMDEAAHKLAEDGYHHPSRVLGNLAEEEATKVLILLDAVRCRPRKQKLRSRTLGALRESPNRLQHGGKGGGSRGSVTPPLALATLARWTWAGSTTIRP